MRPWASMMSQQVKALAIKFDDLNSIPAYLHDGR